MHASSSSEVNINNRLTRKTVRLFYILSPAVSLILSPILWRIRGTGFAVAFHSSYSPTTQTLIGIGIGTVVALAVGLSVRRLAWLASLRTLIRAGFETAKPTSLDLTLAAVSAGFSEELLFRGAVQPLLGIWVTSLIFALAHGGGTKATKGNLSFGLFVFGVSVLLGYICVEFGLVSAMVTHGIIDLLVFFQYRSMVRAGVKAEVSAA